MIWKGTHLLYKVQQLIMHIRAKTKPLGQQNSLWSSETGLHQATHLGKSSEKNSASLKGHRNM